MGTITQVAHGGTAGTQILDISPNKILVDVVLSTNYHKIVIYDNNLNKLDTFSIQGQYSSGSSSTVVNACFDSKDDSIVYMSRIKYTGSGTASLMAIFKYNLLGTNTTVSPTITNDILACLLHQLFMRLQHIGQQIQEFNR
jgi:hypothetical protein